MPGIPSRDRRWSFGAHLALWGVTYPPQRPEPAPNRFARAGRTGDNGCRGSAGPRLPNGCRGSAGERLPNGCRGSAGDDGRQPRIPPHHRRRPFGQSHVPGIPLLATSASRLGRIPSVGAWHIRPNEQNPPRAALRALARGRDRMLRPSRRRRSACRHPSSPPAPPVRGASRPLGRDIPAPTDRTCPKPLRRQRQRRRRGNGERMPRRSVNRLSRRAPPVWGASRPLGRDISAPTDKTRPKPLLGAAAAGASSRMQRMPRLCRRRRSAAATTVGSGDDGRHGGTSPHHRRRPFGAHPARWGATYPPQRTKHAPNASVDSGGRSRERAGENRMPHAPAPGPAPAPRDRMPRLSRRRGSAFPPRTR